MHHYVIVTPVSQVLLESCPGQEISKKALLNTYRQTELINPLASQLSFSPCYPKCNHPRLEKKEKYRATMQMVRAERAKRLLEILGSSRLELKASTIQFYIHRLNIAD